MKYKVCWVTLCRNEEDIIPFCIQYWQRIATKVVVFDNNSTDSSVELLSKYDWIEIRTFDSDGQNDVIQKEVKEQAYLEFKDECSILICTDMDEVFYFENAEKEFDKMMQGGFNTMLLPLYSLCEDEKPQPQEDKLLHQLCHKFYKQKLNHTKGLEAYTKFSIFNTKNTKLVQMSVGQHYVQTLPTMNVMIGEDAFGLHVDKGFGINYKYNIRQIMNKNLSDTNRKGGMCIEYGDTYERLKQEYEKNQRNSFDINKALGDL